MGEILDSRLAIDSVLNSDNLNKSHSELFVRSDENIMRNGQATWIIKLSDLIEITDIGLFKRSPTINIGSSSCCSLNLEFYICGKTKQTESYSAIYIRFKSEFQENTWVQGDISFVDKNKQTLISRTFSKSASGLKEIGFDNFVISSDVPHYARDGKLIIQCKIKMHSTKNKCTSDKVVYDVANIKEINNIKELISISKKFSDVSLCIGAEQMECHKCILASEVPTLRRLFKLENLNYYELKNTEYKEFKEMMDYVYTGNIHILNFCHACKLYIIADMYEVHKLKDICLSYISCNLSEDSVLIAQILADDYKDEILKETCIEFYRKNK